MLQSAQVCVQPAAVMGWTQVLRKIPPEGLLGPTGSRCLCDLARCLVSQKACFLGSRGCAQLGPVITGRQGGLRSASRGVRTDRVGGGREPGGGVQKCTRFPIAACV